LRGLYNAAGSMLVRQVCLENISNNLSNLNTPGYKRGEVVKRTFPEILLYRTQRTAPGQAILSGPIGIAAENIAVEETVAVHEPGALLSTGRQLDVALQGPGFFVLDTPEGPRYTRDGRFHLSADGVLVNSGGYPLLGQGGAIQLQGSSPAIDGEGNIYDGDELVDTLQLAVFEPEDVLWKDRYNMYGAPEGAAVVAGAGAAGETEVFQGYLEESNADLARQMTDLVKVRRSYEASQRLAQVYDRLLSRAANDLGTLG